MDHLTSRFYADDHDLDRMLALVTASAVKDGPRAGHFHRGDVVWGLYQNLTIDPTACVRLFEDEAGRLRGFVWLYPPRGFTVCVNTVLPDVRPMITEMVRWTEAHLTATALPNGSVAAYEAEVSTTDTKLRETLTALGYRPTRQAPYQLNLREMGGEIEEPVLPDGAMVRPVCFDDAGEVEARVALHREVWEPSRFTAEGYARLRTKPVYRPDLDLVAITPDGELASYCIVWWDPDTHTGEFEPVGTSSRFRRQGYGKALLLDGLRRLRAMGATYAIVVSSTAPEYEPSRRLYASAGFQTVTRFGMWERV